MPFVERGLRCSDIQLQKSKVLVRKTVQIEYLAAEKLAKSIKNMKLQKQKNMKNVIIMKVTILSMWYQA